MNEQQPDIEHIKQLFPGIRQMLESTKIESMEHMNEWCRIRNQNPHDEFSMNAFKEELKAYFTLKLADISRAELESAVAEVVASEFITIISRQVKEKMGL